MQYKTSSSQPAPVADPTSLTLNSLLGVQIGADTSGNFALSALGLAIRRADGRYVAKPAGRDHLVDVTGLLLPGVDSAVYRIPVFRVMPGDLIVISDNPLTVRYVLDWRRRGELVGLDPDTGDITAILPIHEPFLDCFVRVVSLLDLFEADSGVDVAEALGAESRADKGKTEEERGMRHVGERLDIEDILLFSLLSGQQPGQAGTPNLLTLLILTRFLGRESDSGLILLLLLSGGLQQSSVSVAPQPIQNNLLLLLLASQAGREEGREGGFLRGRRRGRAGREDPEEPPEGPPGTPGTP